VGEPSADDSAGVSGVGLGGSLPAISVREVKAESGVPVGVGDGDADEGGAAGGRSIERSATAGAVAGGDTGGSALGSVVVGLFGKAAVALAIGSEIGWAAGGRSLDGATGGRSAGFVASFTSRGPGLMGKPERDAASLLEFT